MRKNSKKKKKNYTWNGIKFKSSNEIEVAKKLSRKRSINSWEYEGINNRIQWQPPPKWYVPDFTIVRKDGSILYLECKGSIFFKTDKLKYSTIKKQRPDLDIRFVWHNAHKKQVRAQHDGAEWCEKHGFLWSDNNEIPTEWLKETK